MQTTSKAGIGAHVYQETLLTVSKDMSLAEVHVNIERQNLNAGDSLPAHSHASAQEGFLEKEGLRATCKCQKDEPGIHSVG